MDAHIVLWILGAALTISVSFTGVMIKFFQSAIMDMKEAIREVTRQHEKLQMLVNANSVSIAKFESVNRSLSIIETDIRKIHSDIVPLIEWAKAQKKRET